MPTPHRSASTPQTPAAPTGPRAGHTWIAVALLVLVTPAALAAQSMGAQSLRPYWHVFIAYAIAIVLVMVWAGSIARRISRLEDRLEK